jgi:flagellar L-ring protein precursor FlgH
MKSLTLVSLMVLGSLVAGCGPNHIGPFTPRERRYRPGAYAQDSPGNRPTTGSLFSDGTGGLLEDTRAVRVGDVVVVSVDEDADAEGGASTKLSRDNKTKIGIQAVLGLVPSIKKNHPLIDPEQLLEFMSESDFEGEGDTARRGTLRGSIAVRVTREMPNGDLFVEGTKVLMINNEEYHLYVSGLVRPSDIGPDNTIASSRIADAQIEFTGRGDVADQQRKGWLSRAVDEVNPF